MWSSWSLSNSATADLSTGLMPDAETAMLSSPSYAWHQMFSMRSLLSLGDRKHVAFFLWPSIVGPSRRLPREPKTPVRKV